MAQHFKDAYHKEVVRLFDSIAGKYSRWQLWADFMLMSAIAISNSVDIEQREEREKIYMQTAAKYTNNDTSVMAQIFSTLVDAYEQNPNQDLLGELYMALNLGNSKAGQFFTPYNICSLMAKVNVTHAVSKIEENGYISVNDPACGAGALLIAFANELKSVGVNYQMSCMFVAQDIDLITACMCYIQLSLLGCPGYVVVGDTLCNPFTVTDKHGFFPNHENHTVWYTPMYFSEIWHWRKLASRMDACLGLPMRPKIDEKPVEKEAETIECEKPEPPDTQVSEMPQNEYGQLSFF